MISLGGYLKKDRQKDKKLLCGPVCHSAFKRLN